jgi:hypothetical protein
MAEPEEAYVVVSPLVLQAIKELFWVDLIDKRLQPVLRLVLEVASIDSTSGNLVLSVQVVRDLDEEP